MRTVHVLVPSALGTFVSFLCWLPLCATGAMVGVRMSVSDTQTNTMFSGALDFQRISASAGYALSRIRGASDTITSFDVGATVNAGRTVTVSLGIAVYPESNQYSSAEFNTAVNADFPVLSSTLHTDLGIRFAFAAHSQRMQLWGGRLSEPLVLNQRSATLSIGQELPFHVRVQLDLTSYSYDRDLRQAADFAVVFRAPGVFGMISGFPESGRAFAVSWKATDFLEILYHFSRFWYPLFDDTTESNSVTFLFRAGVWELGVGVSQQNESSDRENPLKYGEISIGCHL